MKFLIISTPRPLGQEGVKEFQRLLEKWQNNWEDVPGFEIEQIYNGADLRTFTIVEADSAEAIIEVNSRVANTITDLDIVPIASVETGVEPMARGLAWATS